jgi:aconitate hydratase
MYRLKEVEEAGLGRLDRLPRSLRILLENLIRHEDGRVVRRADIEALMNWNPTAKPEKEIFFLPARIILQDFTGVPAVVDLAAMRDAMVKLGGDPQVINPLQPADLVVDHSVQVDNFGSPEALQLNTRREFERNRERYAFLKWGQKAFRNFRVVPPETGIIHQVNLEYLARVVWTSENESELLAYPDTLVGTDSHTTMINGLGVLGWGVGGIEAEAAMLGQPISMLIPQVVGFRLVGRLKDGVTATDLVLTVTQILRANNVVGKFVEFFGEAFGALSLPNRATLANMAPEYGATMGFFPVDEETLSYMELSGRPHDVMDLARAYLKEQGLLLTPDSPEPEYSQVIELDISTVEPSLAGPRRPQDRITLGAMKKEFRQFLESQSKGEETATDEMGHGAVVISSITSCTNTSNPDVMLTAGLLARNAVKKGLKSKPWVKTSLAPGSKVVVEYLNKAGLMTYLEQLGFHLVGFGCATCIGNSGPLPAEVASAIKDKGLVVASVLSGNRNFEARVHQQVRANYLASPPLVVAYALAGSVDVDLTSEPLGTGSSGEPVYLRDIWPDEKEIREGVASALDAEMFHKSYGPVFKGTKAWNALDVTEESVFSWDPDSTYLRLPPYFEGMSLDPPGVPEIRGARVLALLGDTVTTDHISPAGTIQPDSPAGRYLIAHGVSPMDFNSYGSRRGNHEVMMRGTFANIRLRNLMVPGVEGGWTVHVPTDEKMDIYDASMKYQQDGVPLVVIAGKEYGTGSSRDWAAKGTRLLGVRAVIVESFERIHRSNLVGMGVLPLQFMPGAGRESLGLTGTERYDIDGLTDDIEPGQRLKLRTDDGKNFDVVARLDTPQEIESFKHGGILNFVLRRLLRSS